MKVYLTYENKTKSIVPVLISAWEKKGNGFVIIVTNIGT